MYHLHGIFSTRKKNFSKVSQASKFSISIFHFAPLSCFIAFFVYINFPLAKSLSWIFSCYFISFLRYGNSIKNQLSPYKTFTCFLCWFEFTVFTAIFIISFFYFSTYFFFLLFLYYFYILFLSTFYLQCSSFKINSSTLSSMLSSSVLYFSWYF